jgi:hypothetical protein
MSAGADENSGGDVLDARMRTSIASVAVCGATLALGTFLLLDRGSAGSVAVGSFIAVANLWTLARVVSASLRGMRKRRSASWVPLAVLKTGGLFAVVWLLLRYGGVTPIAMTIGLAALPIGIAIGSLVSDIAAPELPE